MFVRLGRLRRFTDTYGCALDVGRLRLFLRVKPAADAAADVRGWAAISPHYPCPQLIATLCLWRRTLLVFERWGTDGSDQGLFVDLLHSSSRANLEAFLEELTGTYRKVMLATGAERSKRELVSTLFEDRLAPGGRISAYYGSRSRLRIGPNGETIALADLSEWTLNVNGRALRLDWSDMLRGLDIWRSDEASVWSALTQGDPTDMNIAVPLGWYDYSTAGLNALCGEFANFCWYQAFQGGYLVPRYNPRAFSEHSRTLNDVPWNAPRIQRWQVGVRRKIIELDFDTALSAGRRNALDAYWNAVILPVASAFGFTSRLSALVQPYLALRIIGVYNLCELEPEDTVYSIARLAECWAQDFSFASFFNLQTTEGSKPRVE